MTFTVTFREASGRLVEEVVEMDNRVECIKHFKARGIVLTRIVEGRKHVSTGESYLRRMSWRSIVGMSFVLCTAVGILLIINFWQNESSDTKEKIPQQKARKVEIRLNNSKSEKPCSAPTNLVPAIKTFKAVHKLEMTSEIVPPEVRQDLIMQRYHDINPRIVRDHQLFKHDSDIMLCDLVTARPGEHVLDIEMDKDFDKNFSASLTDPLTVHEKDTPDDIAIKSAVIEMRKKLLEIMDQGESPAAAVKQARDDLNRIADYRELLEQGLAEAAQSKDMTYLESYVKEANEVLDEYGAFHIKIGKKMRARVLARMETEESSVSQPQTQVEDIK